MATLKEQADAILEEKLTDIIPENIREGVEIFDVVGTYKGGGTASDSAYKVKLFDTQEQMQADNTPKNDDLAIVYRQDINKWDGATAITSFTFPKTVTLSEVPSELSSYGYASEDSMYVNIDCYITETSASFNLSGNNHYNIAYESTDGLTYTRTDENADTLVLTEVAIAVTMNEWNDVFSNFMYAMGHVYEGLYIYDEDFIDKDTIKIPYITDLSYTLSGSSVGSASISTSEDSITYNVSQLYSLVNKYLSDEHTFKYMMCFISEDNELYLLDINTIYEFNQITYDENNNFLGISYCSDATTLGDATKYYINIVKLDLENQTYTIEETITGTGISNRVYNGTTSRFILTKDKLKNTKYIPFSLSKSAPATYVPLRIGSMSSGGTNYNQIYNIQHSYYIVDGRYISAPM